MRRDRAAGWLAGVCAGIARRYGVDAALVRLAFVVATVAGGFGIVLYALLWLVMPAGDSVRRSRLPTGRGAIEVALGTGLLLISALLAFRELGIWFSDAVAWPLVLIVSGGALIWRGSATASPAPQEPATAPLVRGEPEQRPTRPEVARAAAAFSRTGVGIALVILAGFVFLQATDALSAARDVILAVIAVVVVLGAIFAPWVLRLFRSLTEERAQRIRSQERAEMAAHLHDSVLHTLALIQRADASPEVVGLARRQERELRAWLYRAPLPPDGRLRLVAVLTPARAQARVKAQGVVEEDLAFELFADIVSLDQGGNILGEIPLISFVRIIRSPYDRILPQDPSCQGQGAFADLGGEEDVAAAEILARAEFALG